MPAVSHSIDVSTWHVESIDMSSQNVDEIPFCRHVLERVRTELPKIYSRELADLLFEQPYLRIANVVDAGIAKRETASKYLKALAAIGVLADEKVGRERLFVNTRLLGILAPEIAHELR